MYHLQLIKYGVYGIYTYSSKKLGTGTLMRNGISMITLFLGKNRFNLHHFYLQCLFQESVESLLFHTAPQSALSSCPPGFLCSKGICGSWELPEGRGQGGARVRGGLSRKRTKYKIQSNGDISLELERSQQSTQAWATQIPFF